MSPASPPSAKADIPPRIVDQAIAWAVKLDFNRAGERTRTDFARWQAADPLHALAWQRVQSLRGEFDAVPAGAAFHALEAAAARRGAVSARRRNALKLLALTGASVGMAWTVRRHAPWQRLLADARTATGEQRTLRLDDGTVLVLNTDTAISVALGSERRLITLRRGEILVTTGHDDAFALRHGAARPFWVDTPFGGMHALGTRFVARLERDGARVSVQEGAVALQAMDATSATMPAVVHAGESGMIDQQGARLTPPSPFESDGWAEGVIAGKSMRLADVLAELSRYRVGHIGCDPRVADLRVSGTYHLRDIDQTLRFLQQTQPIRITWRTRFWVSVGPAA